MARHEGRRENGLKVSCVASSMPPNNFENGLAGAAGWDKYKLPVGQCRIIDRVLRTVPTPSTVAEFAEHRIGDEIDEGEVAVGG